MSRRKDKSKRARLAQAKRVKAINTERRNRQGAEMRWKSLPADPNNQRDVQLLDGIEQQQSATKRLRNKSEEPIEQATTEIIQNTSDECSPNQCCYRFNGRTVERTPVTNFTVSEGKSSGRFSLRRNGLFVLSSSKRDCFRRANDLGADFPSDAPEHLPASRRMLGVPETTFPVPAWCRAVTQVTERIRDHSLQIASRGGSESQHQLDKTSNLGLAAYLLHLLYRVQRKQSDTSPNSFDLSVALCEQSLLSQLSPSLQQAVRDRAGQHEEGFHALTARFDSQEELKYASAEQLAHCLLSDTADAARFQATIPRFHGTFGDSFFFSMVTVIDLCDRYVVWLNQLRIMAESLSEKTAAEIETSARHIFEYTTDTSPKTEGLIVAEHGDRSVDANQTTIDVKEAAKAEVHLKDAGESAYEHEYNGQVIQKQSRRVSHWTLSRNAANGLCNAAEDGNQFFRGCLHDCLFAVKDREIQWTSEAPIKPPANGTSLGPWETGFTIPPSYERIAQIVAEVHRIAIQQALRGAENWGVPLSLVAPEAMAAYAIYVVKHRTRGLGGLLIALCEQKLLGSTSRETVEAVRARARMHDAVQGEMECGDWDSPGELWYSMAHTLTNCLLDPTEEARKLGAKIPWVEEVPWEASLPGLVSILHMFDDLEQWLDKLLSRRVCLARTRIHTIEKLASQMNLPIGDEKESLVVVS